jgi:uncharacterized protein GlcG (DUF336 family)
MTNLDLATGRRIVLAALVTGTKRGFRPLTVVVLDAGGHLICAERQDGASNKRFEIAHAKAHGAVSLGLGSRALMARAEQQAYFIAGATSAVGGALLAVPGGVLIQDDLGRTLGAVGVSGDTSDNDESAAVDGIEAANLVPRID